MISMRQADCRLIDYYYAFTWARITPGAVYTAQEPSRALPEAGRGRSSHRPSQPKSIVGQSTCETMHECGY